MKINEFIAEMQKNLNAEMQKTLTALMEQQANEVSEYEGIIKKLQEQNDQLKAAIRLLTGDTKSF